MQANNKRDSLLRLMKRVRAIAAIDAKRALAEAHDEEMRLMQLAQRSEDLARQYSHPRQASDASQLQASLSMSGSLATLAMQTRGQEFEAAARSQTAAHNLARIDAQAEAIGEQLETLEAEQERAQLARLC
jgi:hypothetical protein